MDCPAPLPDCPAPLPIALKFRFRGVTPACVPKPRYVPTSRYLDCPAPMQIALKFTNSKCQPPAWIPKSRYPLLSPATNCHEIQDFEVSTPSLLVSSISQSCCFLTCCTHAATQCYFAWIGNEPSELQAAGKLHKYLGMRHVSNTLIGEACWLKPFRSTLEVVEFSLSLSLSLCDSALWRLSSG